MANGLSIHPPPPVEAFPSPTTAPLPPCRVLGLARAQVVYVESIARTRKFSLSARLLYHLRIADLVLVQWEELAKTYPRSVYAGRLY